MPAPKIHKQVRTYLILWLLVTLLYFCGTWFLQHSVAHTYWQRVFAAFATTCTYALITVMLGLRLLRDAEKAQQYLQSIIDARREGEERFRCLADATFEGIIIHESGSILEINRAVTRMFGYEAQELVGRPVLDLIAQESLATVRHNLTGDSAKSYEALAVKKDGTLFDVELIARRLPYQGRSVHVAAIRDITERKRAEAELERWLSLLRATLESTADGILVIDREGRVVIYNRKFVELWRIPDFVLHAEDGKRALVFMVEQVKDPELLLTLEQRTFVFELKDGRIFECYSQPQWIAGKAGGRVYGFRDITELKQAEAALRESEKRYRQMFENNQAVKLLIDPETGAIVDANRAAALFYGYSLERLKQMKIFEINTLSREEVEAELARAAAEQRVYFQFRHRLASGEIREVEVHSSPIDFQGRRLLFSIIHDMTERKRAEEALQRANEQLMGWVTELERRNYESSLMSEMGDLLQTSLSVEEAYGIIAQFAERLFPGEAGALCILTPSRNLVEIVAVWGDLPVKSHVFAPAECWALRRGRVHRIEGPNAAPTCRHLSVSELVGYICIPLIAQGEALGILHLERQKLESASSGGDEFLAGSKQRLAVAVAEHVALSLANLKLRETLRSQAIRDPLTGLFNRRYMEESLEREIRRAARSQRPLGVIMIDLDLFKRFNDSFGHAAGDALLRELGSFLYSQVRGEDIACRYGGEEFAIILPEAHLLDTRHRAEQLREGIKRLSIRINLGATHGVTASLGVAAFPEHGPTGEMLLRAADSALYRAKSSGGDCVMVAPVGDDNGHGFCER